MVATIERSTTNFWSRSVIFVILFFLLQFGWQAMGGTWVGRAVIHHGTVRPAAFLINIVTPSARAHADELQLRAVGGGVNIMNGCEGMDAFFLLLAGFAAAALPWRARGVGLLIGTLVVFGVNQARILALFYAYRVNYNLFDRLHEIVAPIVVILVVGGYFYGWLIYASRRPASIT